MPFKLRPAYVLLIALSSQIEISLSLSMCFFDPLVVTSLCFDVLSLTLITRFGA